STNFGLENSGTSNQGFNYTISSGTYRAFLNTVQNDSRFKVLDTPRIFTSNNVKAEINVSQKLPYITSQESGLAGGLISNYQFQDVGVVLTVTPRITSSGQVTMDVVQSADDLQGFTTFNAPIINHREATTTVSVADGQTIVLGGIIRNTVTDTENKIPFLGDIPLLGNLFRSKSKEDNQTELMVFLTPHIVRTNTDAQKLRKQETGDLSKESQNNLNKRVPPPDKSGGN
ncbi:MAG TPA: type II and III secretion system protein, partial [Fimbriimonadaceae bacterium]|nr:type II and III secretion system protein [Fimbriimonadaceae bacterium]